MVLQWVAISQMKYRHISISDESSWLKIDSILIVSDITYTYFGQCQVS